MKILFLDIDGVLNGHEKHPNGYCGILPYRAEQLGVVVRATKCWIVLSSAWRYLILNGSMSLEGFRNLMLTHGVEKHVTERICGTLEADHDPADPFDRSRLAREWIERFRAKDRLSRQTTSLHVVGVDDMEVGYDSVGIPWVKTDPEVGMQSGDAAKLIELLGKE